MARQIIVPRPLARSALATPRELGNLAAWRSLDGPESDATWLSNGSGRLTLLADRSLNSAANCLVVGGGAANYASTPNAAANRITGDLALVVDVTPALLAANQSLIAKWAASDAGYYFLTNSSGGLQYQYAVGAGSNDFAKDSTVTLASAGLDPLERWWLAVTHDVDNGAAGHDIKFWYSADGLAWTQLGATVTTATAIVRFNSQSVVEFGSIRASINPYTGLMHRARIYDGIPAMFGGAGGTLALDANFAAPAKLVGSFTESSANAATITINASGDVGARICGPRDYYQATTGKMPLLSFGAGSRRIATFDASNDFMRCAPYALAQPYVRQVVGSMAAWTSGRYLCDGAAAANTGALVMTSGTPQINLHAGSSTAANTSLPVATRGILTAEFNGASSSLLVNRGTATTGDAGAGTPNGDTLAANGASTAASFGNITFSEEVIRTQAADTLGKSRVTAFEAPRWAVTL
jgi:hypothetical protein